MEEDKRIEKQLLENDIKHYKIIRTIVKGLQFREYYDDIFIEELLDDKILVLFKTDKGIGKINVTSINTDKTLDYIIHKSIENTEMQNAEWHDDDFSDLKINNNIGSDMFYNFNNNEYLIWLKNEIKTVKQKLNLPLNTVYKLTMSQYSLITNKFATKQYDTYSELICLENKTFKKKAILERQFLNNSLAELIIKQLDDKDIPFVKIDFSHYNRVLIKAQALSELLNSYVWLFYADRVYSKQSMIKKEDIGNKISETEFCLEAIPFEGLKFDSEGSRINEKIIIQAGKLVNLLSNNSNSNYLKIKSYGNASLNSTDLILHQRLIFKLNNSENDIKQSTNLTIYNFENIYIDFIDNHFKGIAVYGDHTGCRRTTFSLNVNDIINNIYSVGNKSIWIKNVYCQDVIIRNK